MAGGRWDLAENTADKVRASEGGYEFAADSRDACPYKYLRRSSERSRDDNEPFRAGRGKGYSVVLSVIG